MTRRFVVASLVLLTVLSGVVVVEAERNYARVTAVEDSTATVVDASLSDEGLSVDLAVRNSMNEGLRVQFVHLQVEQPNHVDSASVPFKGSLTLDRGRSVLSTGIPARQLSDDLAAGDRVTISGYVSVEVYNAYEFQLDIEEREVRL